VFINEVLTHTDPPDLDMVELYNPNPTNVNIGNWHLTDQRTVSEIPHPRGHAIPANGYITFTETDWNAGRPDQPFPTRFAWRANLSLLSRRQWCFDRI
jgi:hypothetical protein